MADATAAPPPFLGQILAGITVSLAMVPESLAFTFVAGVSPICGLHAAALMGLTTAALGAQPGVISGAAGATAVVFAPLVASHGPEYLFAAVLMAGVIQLACGAARLGKLIRLVPNTCMIGFVNGLAIVIGAAQLASFRNLAGAALYTQVALTAITAALIIKGLGSKRAAFWPRQIPAPLAAIVLVTLLANVVAPDAFAAAKTVGDVAAVSGALPAFHLPSVPFDLYTLTVIAPFAASVAAVGLIETLLTQQLVDETTLTRTSTHKEVVAQGVGNVVCGVFASMGGCAMIGQSVINVQAGGRTRVAGITCGLAILAYVTFGASVIEKIPIAALVGTMLCLVVDIFEWSSFSRASKIPKTDAVVIALVTCVTVVTNLAVAVFAANQCPRSASPGRAPSASTPSGASNATRSTPPTSPCTRCVARCFSAPRAPSRTPSTRSVLAKLRSAWCWISPTRRSGTAARWSPSTTRRRKSSAAAKSA